MTTPRIIVGIDPGTFTGLAVWDRSEKGFKMVGTMQLHKALRIVQGILEHHHADGILVRVEDARQRKWYGKTGQEVLQGAGSIKRDCTIWEDFLKDTGLDFEMLPPKANKTKLAQASFTAITGWKYQTSEHARDAAMLVYKF